MSELDSLVKDLHDKYSSELEDFTREEFDRIIGELITSGDLVRLCTPETIHEYPINSGHFKMKSFQGMSYIPFRTTIELQSQLEKCNKTMSKQSADIELLQSQLKEAERL